ncbi:hypothetical protein BIV23_45370 [Streptomyces monashensis]|uniref:Uncharacterized protein n=1 Tax=Streptomyces monashensis TaxID=1678012 RepID=A0A1S2NTF5_9ACTN|nr:hypothetical protein BIV23_45370 [Streptomyces monashensis]
MVWMGDVVRVGWLGWLSGEFVESFPSAGLPAPERLAVLPLTLSGNWTGSWRVLPETAPGESCVWPVAVVRPGVRARAVCSRLVQVLPMAGLRRPVTSMVLPQMFAGMCAGSWTAFPEIGPGDPVAAPFAVESACAGPATAMAPEVTARAIALLRVARFMGFRLSAVIAGTCPHCVKRL